MRLLLVLFIVLFTAIGMALVPGCAHQPSVGSNHGKISTQISNSPTSSASEVENIECALKKTSERISQQRQWLQELKSAESELSQPEPDYGW
jgi:hypothetical protein